MFKFIGTETWKKIDGLWFKLSDCGFVWEKGSNQDQFIVEKWIQNEEIHN